VVGIGLQDRETGNRLARGLQYFTGFGKQDALMIGKAHNDANLPREFALLNWIGANSIRTSHYPCSEEVIDHADRQASS
jgi:beta-glucuronidase